VVSARTLRIATRGSALALWQTRWVEERLREADRSLRVESTIVRTIGDRVLDVPLAAIGQPGLFTKELDLAILSGEADAAVHSLKDVPTRIPEGLVLAAILERVDPRDVLIAPAGLPASLETIAPGSRIGTSSLRRRAQLIARRPDLRVEDLRGNLNTRLARLDEGRFDAIILAAAGVTRLGWDDRISSFLEPPEWLPAVGQGALAVVTREDDHPVLERFGRLHHPRTAAAVTAERSFLRSVEGGCQIPVAALAEANEDRIRLQALIASLDGEKVVRGTEEGAAKSPEDLGTQLAERLLGEGGAEILAEVRRNPVPAQPFIGP
jgi:hydroxymethylbilane synthase